MFSISFLPDYVQEEFQFAFHIYFILPGGHKPMNTFSDIPGQPVLSQVIWSNGEGPTVAVRNNQCFLVENGQESHRQEME